MTELGTNLPDCRECGAKCCKYFCFQIDTPESYEEFENLRWYLLHKGVSVHVDEGAWFISIQAPCLELDVSGRCVIYDDRPQICRAYTTENCDATNLDYEFDELFESPEQVEAYARRTLGTKAFDRARAKARQGEKPATSPKKRKTRKAAPAAGKAGSSSKKSKGGPTK